MLDAAQEMKTLNERIQQTPGDASLYFRLGALEAGQGRRLEAAAANRAGLARNPDARDARRALDRLTQGARVAP